MQSMYCRLEFGSHVSVSASPDINVLYLCCVVEKLISVT